jgi:hypothetical protein
MSTELPERNTAERSNEEGSAAVFDRDVQAALRATLLETQRRTMIDDGRTFIRRETGQEIGAGCIPEYLVKNSTYFALVNVPNNSNGAPS